MSLLGKLFFGENERLSVEQIEAEYEAEKMAQFSQKTRDYLEFLDIMKECAMSHNAPIFFDDEGLFFDKAYTSFRDAFNI